MVGTLAVACGEQIGVGTDADVVDADCVDHGLDAFDEVGERVGHLRPHADDAARVGYDLCVFFADEVRLHHGEEFWVAGGSAVEAGVGDDDGLCGHLQGAQHGRMTGVREVDYDA